MSFAIYTMNCFTRLMKNKLMALFNMEGTRNKESFRKTNLMKIISGKKQSILPCKLGECMSYAFPLQYRR